jgi:hypothetical protein
VSGGSDDLRDPRAFRWVESGVSGLARPREWDEVALVEAPGLTGDRAELVVLADGRTLGAEGAGPVHDALALAPPYRVLAVRRDGATWAVAAVAISVAELPGLAGENLVLVVDEDGARSLEVDGGREVAALEQVERLAAGRTGAYVLRGARIEGELWEVALDPL